MSSVLRGEKAQALFKYSAWNSALIAVFFAFVSVYDDALKANAHFMIAAQVIGAILGVPGSVAVLVILFGMFFYLVKVDSTSPKGTWLVLFFFTGPFGAALYYFVVYRKQLTPP
jgi:hypothetical protein